MSKEFQQNSGASPCNTKDLQMHIAYKWGGGGARLVFTFPCQNPPHINS